MDYSTVLSLGGFCQVTHQLKAAGIEHSHSPFDWLITPLESVEKVISDEGAQFCTKVSQYDNGFNDGRDVLCEQYDLIYAHEFPVAPGGSPEITDEYCMRARSKLLHKTRVFVDACEKPGRKLFVRLGGSTCRKAAWPYLKDESPTRISVLNRMQEFLMSRFGREFDLLFVSYDGVTEIIEDEKLHRNILLRNLPVPEQETWQGSPEGWASLFRDVHLHPLD